VHTFAQPEPAISQMEKKQAGAVLAFPSEIGAAVKSELACWEEGCGWEEVAVGEEIIGQPLPAEVELAEGPAGA
jgi:hypothetical protein